MRIRESVRVLYYVVNNVFFLLTFKNFITASTNLCCFHFATRLSKKREVVDTKQSM